MFERILQIKTTNRRTFKQHFLKGVILQLQFDCDIEKCINNNKQKFDTFFQNEQYLKKESLLEKKYTFSYSDEKKEPETISEPSRVVGYSYNNLKNNNKIQVMQNNLFFVQNDYKDYNDLNRLVELFLKTAEANFRISKIGFRKTNSIVAREVEVLDDITSLFSDAVFADLRNNVFNLEDLGSYRNSLNLLKNKSALIINTACAKIKNLNKSYEVIIDTDLIYNDITQKKDALSIITSMNEEHFNIFYWITSDKMKKILDMEEN